jgi:hypothetical protein
VGELGEQGIWEALGELGAEAFVDRWHRASRRGVERSIQFDRGASRTDGQTIKLAGKPKPWTSAALAFRPA